MRLDRALYRVGGHRQLCRELGLAGELRTLSGHCSTQPSPGHRSCGVTPVVSASPSTGPCRCLPPTCPGSYLARLSLRAQGPVWLLGSWVCAPRDPVSGEGLSGRGWSAAPGLLPEPAGPQHSHRRPPWEREAPRQRLGVALRMPRASTPSPPQVFHVAYVLIKFANAPRPDLWVLERSTDFGRTYQPWQFFACECPGARGWPGRPGGGRQHRTLGGSASTWVRTAGT